MKNKVVGVGYEGLAPSELVEILKREKIGLVVDVRKNAWSYDQRFRKEEMKRWLGEADIRYIHLPELGIDSSVRKVRSYMDLMTFIEDEFEVLVRKSAHKMKLLRRVAATVLKKESVALLCMESDQWRCHRKVLLKIVKTLLA